MTFVGYFPGFDPDDDAQFGRKVHTRELIRNISALADDTCFVVRRSGDLPDTVSVVSGGPLYARLFHELRRAGRLSWYGRVADEPVVYCREGPHPAPVVYKLLTGGTLLVEANGIPRDSGVLHDVVRRAKWECADTVIAVSESVGSFVRETYDVDDVVVIENGVDVERFEIRDEVRDAPPYTIGYVGGLQEWQNVDLMLEVVSRVEDARFLVVGGEADAVRRYSRIAEREGVKAEFTGRLPQDRVPEVINRMDLCFGPFAASKPSSPLKVYEYLACGREVVISNEEGLHYLGKYPGVHVLDERDPERLAEQVSEILDGIETNYEARERVEETRSWRAIARKVLEEV